MKKLQIKFTEVKASGNLKNLNGNTKKTRQGDGKVFQSMVGVAITEDMKDFLAKECLTYQIKPAEYIRRLLIEKM